MTKILTQHTDPIRSLVFRSTTNTFATCSTDKTIKIWNLKSNKHKITGHGDSVSGLVFDPNKNQLISGSFDETIRIWEVVIKNNCNLGLLNKI